MYLRRQYLSTTVRKLDRVLSLGGVVSLALGVMMNISRVGVSHVISERVRWHLNRALFLINYNHQSAGLDIS